MLWMREQYSEGLLPGQLSADWTGLTDSSATRQSIGHLIKEQEKDSTIGITRLKTLEAVMTAVTKKGKQNIGGTL